jgi:hypothetical protein
MSDRTDGSGSRVSNRTATLSKWRPSIAGNLLLIPWTGFSAACYALAANIDRSRSIIMGVEQEDRWRAAGIVFDIGHPVADMGDDRSAGPIMEMVVEFWPNHYQALYHAGASNYALGRYERAQRYLEEFLAYYDVDDGFSRNAKSILKRLRAP